MASNATADRIKHMQELRKAHFHFGFDKETNYESAAKCPIVKPRPVSSMPAVNQPVDSLQKNHFHLGSEQPLLQSIAKSDYQRPQSAAISKLSEETKKDLRSHHFQLGFHDHNQPTEYKTKFKVFEKDSSNKVDTESIRKHNHDFGDTNNYYSSMYDTVHNQQYDKSLLGQGYTKEKMAILNTEVRKTHIVMGQDNRDYQTHQLPPRPLQNNFQNNGDLKQLVRNTHIQMGTDRVEYQSHAAATYSGRQLDEGTKLNKEQLKDLRAVHFGVGNDKVDYDSAYKKQFGDRPYELVKAVNPKFQQNNFDLKDEIVRPSIEEHYRSTYNSQFNGQNQKDKAIQVVDRSKNIMIGNDKLSYASEAQSRFKDFRSGPGQLDANMQKDLRSHHFKFGDDKDKMISQNTASFQGQNGQASRMEEGMKKDLRQHHFRLGFSDLDYKTHQQEIGSKQGPPNKLAPEVAQRIKQSSQK